MKYLTLNLLLAIVWMFLTGSFGIGSLLTGFGVGLLVLFMSQAMLGGSEYLRAVRGLVRLGVIFFWKLFTANLQLAGDILRPVPRIKPGFIRLDTASLLPMETALLANMISLTPGTLTVDSGEEGSRLYIHTVYAQDRDELERGLNLFKNLIHGVTIRTPPSE